MFAFLPRIPVLPPPERYRRTRALALWTLDCQTAALIAALLLVVIAFSEHLLAPGFSLSALYLLPLLVAGWNCGWRWGALALVVAITNQAVNGYFYGHAFRSDVFFKLTLLNRSLTFAVFLVLTSQLRALYDRACNMARVDPLTGILNRRGVIDVLRHEIALQERTGRALAVAFIDCDDFKHVNDDHGHAAGDRLLQVVAETLSYCVRRSDWVGRLGGDEFVVVLSGTDAARAEEVLPKIGAGLDGAAWHEHLPVTFSIGLAVFADPPQSADQVIDAADHAMYQAKSARTAATRWVVARPGPAKAGVRGEG